MRRIAVLLIVVLTLGGCATGGKVVPVCEPKQHPNLHPLVGRARPGHAPIARTQIAALARLRQDIHAWAVRCGESVTGQPAGQLSGWQCTSPPVCWSGVADSGIEDGSLCLSGEGAVFSLNEVYDYGPSCRAIRDAQWQDGRWWRAPALVGFNCEQVSFSRDHALGSLAYLVTTRDRASARRWWTYIDMSSKKGLLCPDDNTVLRDFCGLTEWYMDGLVPHWSNEYLGLFHDVWGWLRLPTEPDMDAAASNQSADISRRDHACSLTVDSAGYQIIKVAEQYLVKQYIGAENDYDRQGIACLKTVANYNPFILFLDEGASFHTTESVLRICPSAFTGDNWLWMGSDDQNLWSKSMGWDCIFAVNLLIGPAVDNDGDGKDDLLSACQ